MLWHGTDALPSSYGDDYGAAPSGCEKHRRLRREALRRMRGAPVFTKERRAFERAANMHASRYRACARSAKGDKRSASFQLPKMATRQKEEPVFSPSEAPPVAPPSAYPTGLLVGGALALGLLAVLALSGSGRKAPVAGTFSVPSASARRLGYRRVAR